MCHKMTKKLTMWLQALFSPKQDPEKIESYFVTTLEGTLYRLYVQHDDPGSFWNFMV